MAFVGRECGEQPRSKVSMMIMRPPQHGQGCASVSGSEQSLLAASVSSNGARPRTRAPGLLPPAASALPPRRPIGERGDVERDPLMRIGRALPVERQVQAVLAEQDMGEQLRPGTRARHFVASIARTARAAPWQW
jgi:hypothetical protein